MAINSQKLLPGSSGTALVKYTGNQIELISASKTSIRKNTQEKKKEDSLKKDLIVIKSKVISIDKLLKSGLIISKKSLDLKSKNEKVQKSLGREKKLEEKPKVKGGMKLPSINLPATGLLDSIKRFLFWTVLGRILFQFFNSGNLSKLNGIINVIGKVGDFIEGTLSTVFSSLVNFIDFSYTKYDEVRGLVKKVGGKKGTEIFDKFSSALSTFVNSAIIIGILLSKGKRIPGLPGRGGPGRGGPRGGTPRGGSPKGGSAKPNVNLRNYLGRDTQSKLIERKYGNNAARIYENARANGKTTAQAQAAVQKAIKSGKIVAQEAGEGLAQRGGSSLTKKGLGNAAGRLGTRVLGKGGVKGAISGISKGFGRIPLIGPIVDFLVSVFVFREKPGRAAAGAVGNAVGTAIGGALGTLIPFPGVGTWLGATGGGILGDILGRSLYDAMVSAPKDKNADVQKAATGGYVNTRGGQTQGSGTRTLTVGRVRKIPPKTLPEKTIPGKSIGGIKQIEKLYPNPSPKNNKPNALQALKKTSETLKKTKIVGAIMGASIDIALGQKPSKKIYETIGNNISYLVAESADRQASESMSNLTRAIAGMADGGVIPNTSTQILNPKAQGEILSKAISSVIESQMNDALTIVRKEVLMGTSIRDRDPRARGGYDPRYDGPPGGGGGGDYGDGSGGDVPVEPPMELLKKELGLSESQWDLYRNSIALIESKGVYNIAGGSGGNYDGRYQMGESAKSDAARILGITNPGHDSSSREAFRRNALLQEKMFAGYTIANHRYLMNSSEEYRNANAERKLQILAYAHNQGWSGAKNWLETGQVGADGFGTKGTKYTDLIAENFRAQKSGKKLKVATGASSLESLSAPSGALSSADKAKVLIVMSGESGYRQVMKGESAPTDYLHHGSEDMRGGLLVRDYGITSQVHGGSQMLEGEGAPVVVPIGMRGKAVIEGDHAIRFEDPRTGKVLARYHHLENIPSNINGKVISGGTFIGSQGGRPGASSGYGGSSAVHTHLEGTPEWHKAFINTYAGGLDVGQTNLKPEETSNRPYDVILPLDHHKGSLPPKSLWPNASMGADGRERDAQGPTAEIIKKRLEAKGLRVLIMRPEDYRTEDAYNKDLRKYSQAGSVVSSLHYDAPSGGGGIGFLARLGASPNKDDRDYANKLAPILQAMAREAGGNQRYGGIDTEANITMRIAGENATAALIELGALVEQEKKYGKEFWRNPEFIKHLNDVADATASSVKVRSTSKKSPYMVGDRSVLQGKPVVWNGRSWVGTNTPQGASAIQMGRNMMRRRGEAATRRSEQIQAGRPWWDKFGFFGGAAAEKKRQQENRQYYGPGGDPSGSGKGQAQRKIEGGPVGNKYNHLQQYPTYSRSGGLIIARQKIYIPIG